MTRTVRRLGPARTALAALSSVALMATLSACGGSASADEADALSEVSLVFSGALTVCTDMPYEPFEYEKDGKPIGFDIDLVREVAKDLDVDLDVIDVSFDDITSGDSLNNDVCDLAISAMTITGERARVLDFSSPYFDAKQALITPRGSGLDQLTELAGERVGVQKETTGETYLSDFAPETTQVDRVRRRGGPAGRARGGPARRGDARQHRVRPVRLRQPQAQAGPGVRHR